MIRRRLTLIKCNILKYQWYFVLPFMRRASIKLLFPRYIRPQILVISLRGSASKDSHWCTQTSTTPNSVTTRGRKLGLLSGKAKIHSLRNICVHLWLILDTEWGRLIIRIWGRLYQGDKNSINVRCVTGNTKCYLQVNLLNLISVNLRLIVSSERACFLPL